jgi:Domain of unknown function (DUF1844)
MNDTTPGRSAALFLQLVLGLQQSGMMALGKLMNPISRKVETHLDMARDTIDTLGALEARTRGNLDTDEARVLKQVLTELRMNYLDAVKKSGGSAKASELADEPAPAPARQPDGDPGPAGETKSSGAA